MLPRGAAVTGYPLRLAMVGCGAVVERMHLPASLAVPEVDVVALVDRDGRRAQALAARFGIASWGVDVHEVIRDVDAALVATPPAAHAPVACELLLAGVHVLCEKPLAISTDECRRMIGAAQAGGARLAVGHSRRFHANLAQLKALLDLGAFGAVRELWAEDGFAFSWPTQTGYMFKPGTASGVLLENGIHLLDTLRWLAGGAHVVSYADDALGGVESNAELVLRFMTGAQASVKISRTAQLANRLELVGQLGWASCDLYEGQNLKLDLPHSKAGSALGAITLQATRPQDGVAIGAEQLVDFARSAVEGREPRARGEDGLGAVALVEECYGCRRQRSLPSKAPLPGLVLP
jgi:predicted dehydrogenase